MPAWNLTPTQRARAQRRLDYEKRVYRTLAPLSWVPFVGGPIRYFWFKAITEPDGVYGQLDAMAFHYFGDFLWTHGRPVHQDYFDSWMSRVHFPRWLHMRFRCWRCWRDRLDRLGETR